MARMEKLLVRLDADTRQLLQQLAERQGTSLSDTARLAIREVAWRRGLGCGDAFTERIRKVFQAAAEEARERRQSAIFSEHFLLALLSQRDARGSLMLAAAGVNLDEAYNIVDSMISDGDQRDSSGIGLDDEAKSMIERAVSHANSLSHHYVGTEHLLLALLDEPIGETAKLLISFGVSHQTVRALLELHKERLAARV